MTVHNEAGDPVSAEATLEEVLPDKERKQWWFFVVFWIVLFTGLGLFCGIFYLVSRPSG